MSFDGERLYKLLPAIYRIRDAEQGEPLKALLALIGDEAVILEENLEQLYDDQFIETCAPWVLPYIGDLIGLEGLPGANAKGLTLRAEVSNTIGYRRRKGTPAMLELLARDVTGWPSRAVEFFLLLAATQYMNHLRPENKSFINVRDATRLEWLGTAFERLAGETDLPHNVDVRRIVRRRGRYNIPNVGLFLWRLRAYSLTRSPALPVKPAEGTRFTFNPLGLDTTLFNRPETEADAAHLAEPLNVPAPITRRMLHRVDDGFRHLENYYGESKSILVERFDPAVPEDEWAIPAQDVIVCDLSDVKQFGNVTGWAHTPPAGKVAIDPVLGRIAFAEKQDRPVLVSFHYGFSANTGGGEYDRINSIDAELTPVRQVANVLAATPVSIQSELDALGTGGGVVEITDTGRYQETELAGVKQQLQIITRRRLELRAGDKRRPMLALTKPVEIIGGGTSAAVTLNGLLIGGAGLRVGSGLQSFHLRHCTIVPDPPSSAQKSPGVVVDAGNIEVEIENCIILGGVRAGVDARVRIRNSIIDALSDTGVAYSAPGDAGAGGNLHIENSTVIGKVHATVIELASNTIFLASLAPDDDPAVWPGPVLAKQRQTGCVRFSYLPARSRVPRRYRCQPAADEDAARVRPLLTSSRYNDAGYCQLSVRCPVEIREGADDESEMGAFHDLYQPQREAHLRARLNEYLRFGLEAGIFYAT